MILVGIGLDNIMLSISSATEVTWRQEVVCGISANYFSISFGVGIRRELYTQNTSRRATMTMPRVRSTPPVDGGSGTIELQ